MGSRLPGREAGSEGGNRWGLQDVGIPVSGRNGGRRLGS